MLKKVGLRTAVVMFGVFVVTLFSLVACTRSKLGPVPTLQPTQTQKPSSQTTPPAQKVETKTPGATVVAADVTSTPAVGVTGTVVIPSMTPTPVPQSTTVSPTATPTPVPSTGTGFEYVVQTGDTLWGLAVRFGTTVEAIKTRNNLTSDVIYKGSKLIIPGASGGETVTHVVQPGENLFRISLKYNTTVEAIAAANNIVNPSFVYAGQKLVIVKGSTAPSTGMRYHVVQPGESLWSIAMKYNTTPWKIAAANGIANINFIYAGHTLRIP